MRQQKSCALRRAWENFQTMAIAPVLGQWTVPRIESIRAVESRRLAALPVPGLMGTLHQDLGARSMCVEICGSLHGEEARDGFFEEVRELFRAGEPVDFVADIVSATQVEKVLIEELVVEQSNSWQESLHYRVVLREYVEPPPPPSNLDDLGLDLGLDTDLDLLAGLGLDGLELPDLLVDIPTLGDPVAPVLPALDGLKQATAPLAAVTQSLKDFLSGKPQNGGSP